MTPFLRLRLYQQTELWVLSDDNSAENQVVVDLAGFFRSVDNNCLNNQQLSPLLSLILCERTELWVVPDDNSAQKQGVEYQTGIQEIRTVSTIRN